MGKSNDSDIVKSDSPTRGEFTLLQGVVVGITFVIIVTVIGFILNALAEKQASYLQLTEKVMESNRKVDEVKEEINDLNTALGVKKVIEANTPLSIEIKKELKIGE